MDRDFQSRHIDLRRQELHLALHLFDPATYIAEFFGNVERVFDGRGALQNLQVLRFFGLSIAQARIEIDVLASNIARFHALPVNGSRHGLNLRDDRIEACGRNPDGD